MRKSFSAALLALMLCLLLCASAFAYGEAVVFDSAGLLSYEEQDSLSSLALQLCEERNFQLVIVTVNGTDGQDITVYADDFYDNGGFLEDGALFIIDMSSREWYISTAGRGIQALSDSNIDIIADDVIPYLSAGEYYEGFRLFIECCADYVESYDNGGYTPDDGDYYVYPEYGDGAERTVSSLSPLWIPGSIGIGLVLSFLVMSTMKSGMNSVRFQKSADCYANRSSLNLAEKQDVFLYHTLARTPRPKDSDRGSGGSFGGGIHMSGGGVSHGGHGGRF